MSFSLSIGTPRPMQAPSRSPGASAFPVIPKFKGKSHLVSVPEGARNDSKARGQVKCTLFRGVFFALIFVSFRSPAGCRRPREKCRALGSACPRPAVCHRSEMGRVGVVGSARRHRLIGSAGDFIFKVWGGQVEFESEYSKSPRTKRNSAGGRCPSPRFGSCGVCG